MTAKATIYMPFAELVDLDKEIGRLTKEEEKLKRACPFDGHGK